MSRKEEGSRAKRRDGARDEMRLDEEVAKRNRWVQAREAEESWRKSWMVWQTD